MPGDERREGGNIGQGEKFVTGVGNTFPLKFFREIPLRKRMSERIADKSV